MAKESRGSRARKTVKVQVNPWLPAVPTSAKKGGALTLLVGVPLTLMGTDAAAAPQPPRVLEVSAELSGRAITNSEFEAKVLGPTAELRARYASRTAGTNGKGGKGNP